MIIDQNGRHEKRFTTFFRVIRSKPRIFYIGGSLDGTSVDPKMVDSKDYSECKVEEPTKALNLVTRYGHFWPFTEIGE
jgi:hypothetical protein